MNNFTYKEEIEILSDKISSIQDTLVNLHNIRRGLNYVQHTANLFNEDMLSAIESVTNLIILKDNQLKDLSIQYDVYNIKNRHAA